MGFFSNLLRREPPERVVFLGQLVLNAGLIVAGLVLLAGGSWRARLLLAMVPLVFAPFSYARLRLHRLLAAHAGSLAMGCFAAAGLACDAVMAAQLLTARQSEALGWLHLPGVTWIGAVWYSTHALLLLAYGLKGLLRLGHRPLRRVLARRAPVVNRAETMIGRRELLQKASLAGAAIPFGVSLSGVPLSYDFRVERREITLPHWPQALDGLKVAHLSDIHVGGAMDLDRLLRVAELTNQCRPDLVLHTGDFLTHRPGDFDRPLYEALAQIRAPHGQWACLGNHDYDNAPRFERRLRECGVMTLRNARTTLAIGGTDLEIAGLEFVFDRPDRRAVFRQVMARWGRTGTPRLLLNHDPSTFEQLPGGCADLVLSGHTHGGHVGLQLGASHALTVVGLAGIPDQGFFRRGDMHLYVTRCVGFYGYPIRIGIPPEIALLVLRAPRPSEEQAS
jgi:predicted MPP superfamily phosphohydrolase